MSLVCIIPHCILIVHLLLQLKFKRKEKEKNVLTF